MQPSSYYESSEQTLNGFKYKRTNKSISELFPVNENIDLSCVYSSNWGTPEMNGGMMMGWANDSSAAYVQKDPVFHHSYKSSSTQEQDNRWTNINGVIVKRSEYDYTVNCGFVFTTAGYGSYNYFTFGYAPDASSIVEYGDFENKNIVTDFEVNKIIWKLTNITGITKAELQDYYDNGTVTSAYSISASDFFANPANYLITKYSISGLAYWDDTNEQWQTNNHPFGPVILIDSAETGGFYCINVATGGQSVAPQANTIFGLENGKNIGLWNNTQNNTTAVTYNRYQASIHREFIRNFTLGNDSSDLEVMPYEDSGYLYTLCDQHFVGTKTLSPKELTGFNPWMIATQQDSYTYSLDYTGADKSHPTAYTKNIKVLLKGEMLSKILAHIGVYFFNDTVADLNSREATPTHMNVAGMMLGEMLDTGYTTGNWVKGNDIEDYKGINKDGSSIHPDFDPSGGGGGGGGYDDDPWSGASFSGVGVGGAGAFAKCYYMTSTELANLRTWMNSNNVPEGFDPMQQIIGLSQVPVSLSGDDNTTVQFVNSSAVYDPGVTRLVDSGVNTQISMGIPKRYSLGSVDIVRRMQERGEPYLDYDCQIELYLPLIGVFSLDTQAVMGRTITAEAVLDPISGTLAAYAYVSRDGQSLPIAYGSTTIGVDLPITAQQYSVARAALKQANAQLGTSLLSSTLSLIAAATAGGKGSGTGAKTATGSTNGLAAAGIREAGADYMKASQAGNVFGDFMQWGRTIRQLSYGNNTAVAGSFGGSSAQWSYPFTPYVKIIRPRYEKPSNYNHSQGVPCVQAKTVGSCTGFIQCIGVDVSGITGATDLELQAIQAALSNGIYAGGGQ